MIVLTGHARDKLLNELFKLGINEDSVSITVNSPDELLYDVATGRFVAVKYDLNIAVIYEKTRDAQLVVTVIYSAHLKELVERRRRAGRWI
nr:hypothetical conserved protein [Candidatus Caldarchaeum subterraneum]